MAQNRTAAQAAQDKNRDQIGRFQHNQTFESVKVKLGGSEQQDELKDSMAGVRALSSLGNMAKSFAVKNYLDQISRNVLKHYPTAVAINFDFRTEMEDGVCANFDSITDADGNSLDVDQDTYNDFNAGAYVNVVDHATLQNSLEYVENEDERMLYTYELVDKDEAPFARQIRAENYNHSLFLMEEILQEQRANASVSVAMHNVIDSFPGLEEITLGRSFEPGWGARVESFVQNGKTYQNPGYAGKGKKGDGIDWFRLDRSLDRNLDYSSMIAKPIKVNDALNWSPGQSLTS